MLDRVQKTKLCHAFSFPLSAIRHASSSSAWPRGAVPSVSQPSGMRWHANSKKRSPHKPLRLLNKRAFQLSCSQTWSGSENTDLDSVLLETSGGSVLVAFRKHRGMPSPLGVPNRKSRPPS